MEKQQSKDTLQLEQAVPPPLITQPKRPSMWFRIFVILAELVASLPAGYAVGLFSPYLVGWSFSSAGICLTSGWLCGMTAVIMGKSNLSISALPSSSLPRFH